VYFICKILFLPLIILFFSACSTTKTTQVAMVDKSTFVANKQIDNIKVVWSNKPYNFSEPKIGTTVILDFGLSMGLANVPDSINATTHTKDEVNEFFTVLGNKLANNLQQQFLENKITYGDRYLLEITPRKAYVQAKKPDSPQQPIIGSFMVMASLKDTRDMSEIWFIKAYVAANSLDTNNQTIDYFSSMVMDNMRVSGFLGNAIIKK
jgi:hypothetical protein